MNIIDDMIADMVLGEIAEGVTLSVACRKMGLRRKDVYAWRDLSDENRERYKQARDDGYDMIAEECQEIADNRADDRDAASRKMRVWTRLELLKVWDPRRYGQRTAVDATIRSASVITTLPADISDEDAARAYQAIMKDN